MRGVIDRIDWAEREQMLTWDGGVAVQMHMRRIGDAARARGLRANIKVLRGHLLRITLEG